MNMKHTPGYWVREGLFIYDGTGEYIAQINLDDDDQDAQANAQLIAAAPELLEALRFARDELIDCGGYRVEMPVIVMIDEIIAKATGGQQ